MPTETILITGGAGFIGSNFVPYFLEAFPQYNVVNLDKLTYAGNLDNLKECENNARYAFIKGDICNSSLVEEIFDKYDIRGVIHFAAESHVDNSITGPLPFIETNIKGTFTLLEAARKHWLIAPNEIKKDTRIAVFTIFPQMKFMEHWGQPVYLRKKHPMLQIVLIPPAKPPVICSLGHITILMA